MRYSILGTIIFFGVVLYSCHNEKPFAPSVFTYFEPSYENISLRTQSDTLNFFLSENTYNEIRTFNYFEDHSKEYIAFYDRRSESINIFDLHSCKLVKRLLIEKCLPGKQAYKASAYVKNFDSILIVSERTLYLVDSARNVKGSINFSKDVDAMAYSDPALQPIFKNGITYMGVRSYINELSFSSIKKWKVVYAFDFKNKKRNRVYNVPELYWTNLYGERFFNYSFCINEKGNLVFSFPADTNIYETNLDQYHKSYYGKSRYQSGSIPPVPKEQLVKSAGLQEFKARDSYGPIFYDHVGKRYMRFARQKKDSTDSSKVRRQSVIFFDNNLKIIGENPISSDFLFNSLFITRDGNIYARVNVSDEYALHFVRLRYVDTSKVTNVLAQTQVLKN